MRKFFGAGDVLPLSVDDVMVLLTGDALFGKGKDREAGLVIFFMSYIRPVRSLMKNVLACRTKR